MKRPLSVLIGLAALVMSACASNSVKGPYVWATALPIESADSVYRIQAGDEVTVSVWGNDALGAKARVRSDGKMTLPLLGDVVAVGHTATSFARRVEVLLAEGKLVNAPRAAVQVDEQVNISVLGKVARAGTYPLPSARGVAEALAAAGGLTEFARKDRVFVLRRTPQPVQIRFRFSALFDAADPSSRFRLRGGDVVVVD